jgi:LCP family protein required for cell wall assembly
LSAQRTGFASSEGVRRGLFLSTLVLLLLSPILGGVVAWLQVRPFAHREPVADDGAPIDPDLRPPPRPSGPPDAGAVDGGRADAGPVDAGPSLLSPEDLARIRRLETQRARTPNLRHTTNYLLVGADRWVHRPGGRIGRADALLVGVFHGAHAGVISIPRDLYVEIPGHGPARIASAMRLAHRLDREPLAFIRRVVTDTLAMPIHHVVVADFDVFVRAVDALGGLDVDVPCPIRDNFVDPSTETGRRLLDLDAGRQRVDGSTALMLARSRHGRTDWSRARRQQAILLAMRRRVQELPLTAWTEVLSTAVADGLQSDLTRLELLRLARRLARLNPRRIHGMMIDHRMVESHVTEAGQGVLLPRWDAIDEGLRHLFEAPPPGVLPPRARCRPRDVALWTREEQRHFRRTGEVPPRSREGAPEPEGHQAAAAGPGGGPQPVGEDQGLQGREIEAPTQATVGRGAEEEGHPPDGEDEPEAEPPLPGRGEGDPGGQREGAGGP